MSCPKCGEKESRSPCGDWCNNCGWQNPCECWGGDHKGCRDSMNEKREKSGYLPLATSCCCGKATSISN